MRAHVLSYSIILLLGLFVIPTTQAESGTENQDYRIPLYDKIEFKAEATENKVYMTWSAFEGHNDEEFEYYKVIRSYSNSNPLYPEDGAIKYFAGLGDTRYTDENAYKSAYYRVCAITLVKGRHCSNTVWVEIEKPEKKGTENKDWQAEKAEKQAEWQQKQDEAKERLAAKKEAAKAEWERKQAENKEKWEAKKTDKKQQWSEKKQDHKDDRWNKLYTKLDSWLERFGERLKAAQMTNEQKVEKIEQIQARFYAWEKDNELRMKMVDHLDETLNAWKAEYSSNSDFDEIDSFLEGLLD